MINVMDVKRALDARPFKPFEVTMSSGEKFHVPHPEVAFVTRRHLLIGLKVKDGVPADYQLCSMLHITSIKPLVESPGEPNAGGEVPVSNN